MIRWSNIFLIIILFSFSCRKEYTVEDLVGKWRLIESYFHGGATLHHEIEKEEFLIEFFNNGEVVFYNRPDCFEDNEETALVGVYSKNDMFVELETCTGEISKIYFEFDAHFLKLKPMCAEPCFTKYKKAD